jgi:hypothetical protein
MSVYIYGELFGRYDVETERFIYEEAELEQAIAIALSGDDSDDFLDAMSEKYGWNKSSGIGYIFMHDDPVQMFVEWVHHRSFGIFYEEGMYGVSDSKEGAKAAYVKQREEAEGGDDDWGDDE